MSRFHTTISTGRILDIRRDRGGHFVRPSYNFWFVQVLVGGRNTEAAVAECSVARAQLSAMARAS